MMEEHICRAVGCSRIITPSQVSRKVFLCTPHWEKVPLALKDLLSWRGSDETAEYLATVFVVISLMALDDGKPLPSFATDIPAEQEAPLFHRALPYPD